VTFFRGNGKIEGCGVPGGGQTAKTRPEQSLQGGARSQMMVKKSANFRLYLLISEELRRLTASSVTASWSLDVDWSLFRLMDNVPCILMAAPDFDCNLFDALEIAD